MEAMNLIRSVSGIRGIVGQSLTERHAATYAAALAASLGGGTVIVGRDTRPSGQSLQDYAVRALMDGGCRVVDLGIVTTPGAAFMLQQHGAAGGLLVTASHNPAEWNGLKFLTAEGSAPDLQHARRIWDIHDRGDFEPAQTAGSVIRDTSAAQRHASAAAALTSASDLRRRRFKVVLDSNHGAGGEAGRRLLECLGCEVVALYPEPHGRFAHGAEPLAENLTGLEQAVREAGADIGFAQDPDADRLAVVDDHGHYLGEDYTLALAAMYMFETHPGPAATTLSTSRMIDDLATRSTSPCPVHRTAVGEAHVVDAIRKHHCVIGGEGNGGVIDPRIVLVRDSLTAMALILELLLRHEQTLSRLVQSIPQYAMIKRKVECPRERIADVLAKVRAEYSQARCNDTDGLRLDWDDRWVHVRGSNTEPVLRVIAEAPDRPTAESVAASILELTQVV